MTRLFQCGWEIGFGNSSAGAFVSGGPDGYAHAGTPTIDTATKRTGASSLKVSGTAQSNIVYFPLVGLTQAYVRVYFYKTANPSSNGVVIHTQSNNGIALLTTGQLQAQDSAGSLVGSASSVLSNSTWHLVEYYWEVTGGNNYISIKVNGVVVQTAALMSAGGTALNYFRANGIAGADLYFDDLAVNSTSGSVNNSWVGPGKVVLLKSISDNQVGSWLAGGGGATNLYDALDNTPPTGAAGVGTNTSQIKNNVNGGGTNYKPNLTTYTTAGIGASDTIFAIQGFVCHAEEVNTGTKTGQFRIASNPTDAGFVTFTFADDQGGSGAYASTTGNWRWKSSTPVESPSVTLGTSPTMELDKTDAGTRNALACFMGAYVDYTPPITITIGTGTNPTGATVGPFSGYTAIAEFTLTGSDLGTVTGATVAISGTLPTILVGATISIWDSTETTNYGNTTISAGVATFTGLSIPVTTSSTAFKIRMYVSSFTRGTNYSGTAQLTSVTGGTNAGSHTAGNTFTIDDASPGAGSGLSLTPSSGQIAVSFTSPADSDVAEALILVSPSSNEFAALSAWVEEGSTYNVSDPITNGFLAYVGAKQAVSPSTSYGPVNITGLTNGTIHYISMAYRDAYYNWNAYSSASSATPSAGAASHPSSGALSAQAATLSGTAAHFTLHPTSGALSAQSATLSGTATHNFPHPTSGALTAGSATVSGTAAHILSHATSGALSAQSATISGTAAHQHAATGSLTAGSATISGTAARQHASTGTLAAQAATLSGTSVHYTLHPTSGALSAQSATISGTAAHQHASTGALSAQSATLSGTAAHLTLHTTSGALSAQSATLSGTSTHTGLSPSHDTSGALAAQAATLSGTAVHYLLHTTSGALSAQSATVSGSAADQFATTGSLAAQSATLSGTATRAAAATSWTISPTGGVAFAGSGVLVRENALIPTGGVVLAGASTIIRIRTITPSGGVAFSGGPSLIKTKIAAPGGSVSFGGTAPTQFIPFGVETPSYRAMTGYGA